ncbi:MAG: hypothetical protein EPN97_00995 [Alphaproteobacteria bacterium]|nr:MAG: hypothetical protein EPN97_00995 [Alphaproteobacteria bacterium]
MNFNNKFNKLFNTIGKSGTVAAAVTVGTVAREAVRPLSQHATEKLLECMKDQKLPEGEIIPVINRWFQDGADLNAKDDHGFTALLYAVAWHQSRVIQHLVEKGADVDLRDDADATPLMYAACCNENVTDALLEAGANPELRNSEGKSALDLATRDRIKVKLQKALHHFELQQKKKFDADVDANLELKRPVTKMKPLRLISRSAALS